MLGDLFNDNKSDQHILQRRYMYHLTKYGVEYVVHAVHYMKTNIYFVFASQMKRLANAGNNFFL